MCKILNKKFILKLFIAFLKKEGVYEQYLKNTYLYFRTTDKVIEAIILRIQKNPTDLLLTFWWDSSVEKYEFWHSIDTKWRTKLIYGIMKF